MVSFLLRISITDLLFFSGFDTMDATEHMNMNINDDENDRLYDEGSISVRIYFLEPKAVLPVPIHVVLSTLNVRMKAKMLVSKY